MFLDKSVNPLVLLFLGIVSFSIYLIFIVDFMMVEGQSMFPVFQQGDIIFINRFAYGFRLPFSKNTLFYWQKPDYRDIVVVKRGPRSARIVKRIFALENDVLLKRKGSLELGEEKIPLSCSQEIFMKATLVVPRGQVFLLGDNQQKSIDSRDYGSLPLSAIEGQVFFCMGRL